MLDGGFITAPASYYYFIFLPYFIVRVLFQTIKGKKFKISENEKKIIILLPVIGIGTLTVSFHSALWIILNTLYEDPVILNYPTVFSY